MILSKIENVKPEPQPNDDSATDNSQVSPAIGNTNVMRRFVEEDLDNCWSHYKSYLIDILNGDYDLNEAREDLLSLINSQFDKRSQNNLL